MAYRLMASGSPCVVYTKVLKHFTIIRIKLIIIIILIIMIVIMKLKIT